MNKVVKVLEPLLMVGGIAWSLDQIKTTLGIVVLTLQCTLILYRVCSAIWEKIGKGNFTLGELIKTLMDAIFTLDQKLDEVQKISSPSSVKPVEPVKVVTENNVPVQNEKTDVVVDKDIRL